MSQAVSLIETGGIRWAACTLFLTSIASAVYASDDDVEFDGYSPVARLMVEKLLQSVGRVSTYSDHAVVKTVTAMPMGRGEQPASFAYVRPRRFSLKTETYEIHGDGKELTTYAKRMRRYTVTPIEKDVAGQVGRHAESTGMPFGVAGLFLSSQPRREFADRFHDLDLAGRDVIDQDRCYVLEGTTETSLMGLSEAEVEVALWLRESDSLIRRVEFDLTDAMKKRFESLGGMFRSSGEYKVVYDVRDLQVNEPVPERVIAFLPPTGSKKVERFYTSRARAGASASQFELSGKPAPDFELETPDGQTVTLDSLAGDVVILDFLSFRRSRRGGGDIQRFERLDEIRREYADRNVAVVCVCPQTSADRLADNLRDNGLDLTIALDPGRAVAAKYFEDTWASGLVLISSDGIVQGSYRGYLSEDSIGALRSDVDKLLVGQSLPIAKRMSDAQIAEAREQRAANASPASFSDPINEDDLEQVWAVSARGARSFAFRAGSSASSVRDLWIRDGNVVRRISPDGKVTAEIPIAHPSTDALGRGVFVAGRLGTRWGVVYMASIPGEREYMGFRPAKGATLTASDESGRQLWQLELQVSDRQLPQHLTLADLDGRRGDELIFVHQGAIWVVDEGGDLLVRKPCPGSPQWLLVDDYDRDGRCEIYLRTQYKLKRFDYRPNR